MATTATNNEELSIALTELLAATSKGWLMSKSPIKGIFCVHGDDVEGSDELFAKLCSNPNCVTPYNLDAMTSLQNATTFSVIRGDSMSPAIPPCAPLLELYVTKSDRIDKASSKGAVLNCVYGTAASLYDFATSYIFDAVEAEVDVSDGSYATSRLGLRGLILTVFKSYNESMVFANQWRGVAIHLRHEVDMTSKNPISAVVSFLKRLIKAARVRRVVLMISDIDDLKIMDQQEVYAAVQDETLSRVTLSKSAIFIDTSISLGWAFMHSGAILKGGDQYIDKILPFQDHKFSSDRMAVFIEPPGVKPNYTKAEYEAWAEGMCKSQGLRLTRSVGSMRGWDFICERNVMRLECLMSRGRFSPQRIYINDPAALWSSGVPFDWETAARSDIPVVLGKSSKQSGQAGTSILHPEAWDTSLYVDISDTMPQEHIKDDAPGCKFMNDPLQRISLDYRSGVMTVNERSFKMDPSKAARLICVHTGVTTIDTISKFNHMDYSAELPKITRLSTSPMIDISPIAETYQARPCVLMVPLSPLSKHLLGAEHLSQSYILPPHLRRYWHLSRSEHDGFEYVPLFDSSSQVSFIKHPVLGIHYSNHTLANGLTSAVTSTTFMIKFVKAGSVIMTPDLRSLWGLSDSLLIATKPWRQPSRLMAAYNYEKANAGIDMTDDPAGHLVTPALFMHRTHFLFFLSQAILDVAFKDKVHRHLLWTGPPGAGFHSQREYALAITMVSSILASAPGHDGGVKDVLDKLKALCRMNWESP